jgi:hypothetical protein
MDKSRVKQEVREKIYNLDFPLLFDDELKYAEKLKSKLVEFVETIN